MRQRGGAYVAVGWLDAGGDKCKVGPGLAKHLMGPGLGQMQNGALA